MVAKLFFYAVFFDICGLRLDAWSIFGTACML